MVGEWEQVVAQETEEMVGIVVGVVAEERVEHLVGMVRGDWEEGEEATRAGVG